MVITTQDGLIGAIMGYLPVNTKISGKRLCKCPGFCDPLQLSEADMSHKIDDVTWWNNTGRYLGPKPKAVSDWMLDSDNYYFDYFSINSTQGALLGQVYFLSIM